MLSKTEAIWIFLSIALMAAALAFWRFGVADWTLADNIPQRSQEAVVVAAGGDAHNAALADAISQAATSDGDLRKLIIDDVRVGAEGPEVREGDKVTVNYEGTTKDGIRFDSSYERGEPFTFTVGAGKVIEGWEQGVLGMRVGGERILVVPPQLAYGSAQVGPIPPNSILVFKIELLSIN